MSAGLDLVLGILAGGVVVTLGSLTPAISRRLNPRPPISTREVIALSKWDGHAPHPDLSAHLALILRAAAEELRVCKIDHPEDERLSRVEANLRWLLGERI